jgi:cyanoexosortase B-associated protein
MQFSLPPSWHLSRAKFVVLALLMVLLLLQAVPQYLVLQWPWTSPPAVQNLGSIRQIRKQGITIAGWPTTQGRTINLSEHQWYAQEVRQGQQNAMLFLLPQTSPKNQPQVEWSDLEGVQRWQSDAYQTLKLPIAETQQTIEARFFRAWTKSNTFAVVQWYAQPQGGNAVPAKWYWADRWAQWQGQRVPWVAVSIQVPIAPLGDLGKARPQVESLVKAVQLSLNPIIRR